MPWIRDKSNIALVDEPVWGYAVTGTDGRTLIETEMTLELVEHRSAYAEDGVPGGSMNCESKLLRQHLTAKTLWVEVPLDARHNIVAD